jgi:hypothetical protein
VQLLTLQTFLAWLGFNAPVFRAWLKRETNHSVPHESTLRKQYLNIVYKNTMSVIRETVKNRKILISIDDTINATGRKVANVIVGILLPDRPGEKFLLTSEELLKCDAESIARLFHDSLKLLGEDFNWDSVLLLVTDGVAYMAKAGNFTTWFTAIVIHINTVRF